MWHLRWFLRRFLLPTAVEASFVCCGFGALAFCCLALLSLLLYFCFLFGNFMISWFEFQIGNLMATPATKLQHTHTHTCIYVCSKRSETHLTHTFTHILCLYTTSVGVLVRSLQVALHFAQLLIYNLAFFPFNFILSKFLHFFTFIQFVFFLDISLWYQRPVAAKNSKFNFMLITNWVRYIWCVIFQYLSILHTP